MTEATVVGSRRALRLLAGTDKPVLSWGSSHNGRRRLVSAHFALTLLTPAGRYTSTSRPVAGWLPEVGLQLVRATTGDMLNTGIDQASARRATPVP